MKNDSAIEGVGGRLRRLSGEHKSVRMVRETVRLSLAGDPARDEARYRVEATFLFHNDGPALTVGMGFPESGGGDIRFPTRSKMVGFVSTVDGAAAKVRWKLTSKRNEDTDYDALWIKEVRFGANQSRTVTVRYEAPYGSRAMPDLSHFVSYDFTGGNWKGTVEESVLQIRSSLPGMTLLRVQPDEKIKTPDPSRVGDALAFTWRSWQAEYNFSAEFGRGPAGWMAPAEAPWPFDIPLFTVERPGEPVYGPGVAAPTFDALPPAIRRGEIVYGAVMVWNGTNDGTLDDVENLFGLGNFKSQTSCKLDPRGLGGSVRIVYGGKTATFAPGKKTVDVGGQSIELPGAPFAIKRRNSDAPALYVPIVASLDAVGVKATLKATSPRRYTLSR